MPLLENRQALTKDDVFGTLSGTSASVPNRREIGAIGEGRQKDDQPQEADVSVESERLSVIARFMHFTAYMHCATRF